MPTDVCCFFFSFYYFGKILVDVFDYLSDVKTVANVGHTDHLRADTATLHTFQHFEDLFLLFRCILLDGLSNNLLKSSRIMKYIFRTIMVYY